MNMKSWYSDIKKNIAENRMVNKALMAISASSIITVIGSADIASDISNFTQIIGNGTYGFTGFFISMMQVFMQPPLVYFVALGFLTTFIHLAGSFLIKRGR